MRFTSRGALSWVGIIVPLLQPVGGGNIEVSISDKQLSTAPVGLPDTGDIAPSPGAELGELILVRADWRRCVPPPPTERAAVQMIDESAAATIIARTVEENRPFIRNQTQVSHNISREARDYAEELLSSSSDADRLTRARVLFLLGANEALTDYLEAWRRDTPLSGALETFYEELKYQENQARISWEDWVASAEGLISAKKFDEADTLLSDAITRFPEIINVHIVRAWIPVRIEDWPDAIRRWDVVRELFPDHHVGYLGLALSLRAHRRQADAEEVLATAIERFPAVFEVHREYASYAVARKDWKEALRRYRTAQRRFPAEPRIYDGIAICLQELGDTKGASEMRMMASDLIASTAA